MRTPSILAFSLATAGLVLALGARPAAAQDILGLTMRPTDEMPAGTGNGTVDIVADGPNQSKVSVDLSAAAENLKLENFKGAKAFVVWILDGNGVRHNAGKLDDGLVLKDAVAAYPVAKIYLTAEADAAAASPTGNPLFTATLRNVAETDNTATPGAESTSASAAAAATEAPKPTAAASAAASAATSKPKELPTTGDTLPDLSVLALVAVGLLLAGWRLRATRV